MFPGTVVKGFDVVADPGTGASEDLFRECRPVFAVWGSVYPNAER
jgi:hypothetical protein